MIAFDDREANTRYANYCRLTSTPEELILDLGLDQNGPATADLSGQQILVTQRIVLGWHAAKRLLELLQLTVERHEATFGVLETNVHNRVLYDMQETRLNTNRGGVNL